MKYLDAMTHKCTSLTSRDMCSTSSSATVTLRAFTAPSYQTPPSIPASRGWFTLTAMFSAASPPASLRESWRPLRLNPAFSMRSVIAATSLQQPIHQSLIIGIIDTGIMIRSHPSFKDTNMPPQPPPANWKGSYLDAGFPCNNKIIGAKAFYQGANPPVEDISGHGTHVASIAAGNFVKDANVLGMAKGDPASGMASMAYLSIYQVCFVNEGCDMTNIYAGIDQAIVDEVDILSMSISGDPTDKLYEVPISRGSMAAIQYGIIPVASAGNAGPDTGHLVIVRLGY
ncbi:Cucumisin [Dendrobium catenatum]|uniref:Cucumisin n=1 Tax=Dendrobium catenatum TaxID=906689 RepID=A0A2I0V9G1_9ASPA|nr:Cucumisin [Dendrobium catenatum]